MMRLLKLAILIAVLYGALMLLVSSALAQVSNAQVLINYPEIAEDGDGLGLGLYFNLINASGQVITDAQPQSARMLLDDGTGYDATVAKPTSPIYIALVLDASGSMGGAAESMRQAAIQAVNNAPQEARFAVIRFNDQIDVLEQFTEDRNRAINAIGQVQPRNLAGTCLYDAAFRAIELMGSAPPGRRAIILFTDGRDETAQGTVCSSHVFSEVVDLASQPQARVPIHTIGLSGGNSAINASELRDIAGSTGGLSAIGDQATLNTLFTQIMDALKAQWFSRAVIYPTQGQHTAQLLVTMGDGSFPQPAVAVFVSPRDFRRQPTITPTQPTPTPTIVTVAVDSVAADPATETISVQARAENERLVTEYRFEFMNANNLLQAEFIVPAPLQERMTFPSRNLSDGENTVRIIALDENRRIIVRSEPFKFTYLRPTATPPPPTDTPEPISATLTSIQYNRQTDVITLNINLLGANRIDRLQINVVNADTNLLEQSYPVPPATSIELPSTGLTAEQDYIVNVIAQNASGQIISQSNSNFTYTPIVTPSPTPVSVSIAIASINISETSQEFVIQIQAENPSEIDRYDLRMVQTDTGLLVGNFEYQVPPFDTVRVPLSGISGGQYKITLNALGENNRVLATYEVEARYNPPTPTPTVTPITGIQAFIANARSNPIIIVVIGLVAVGLILLLFLLLRQPKKAKTGTSFLQEMTGAQPIAPPSQQKQNPAVAKPLASNEATNAVPYRPAMDGEATNAIPFAQLPGASLTVTRTRDVGMNGQVFPITHIPYTLGRRGRDLNFEQDDNVSRAHAQITYVDGIFYVTDEGSTHGTAINGNRIPARTPVAIDGGARLMLGTTTMLTFETSGVSQSTRSDYDPDRTNV